MSCRVVPSVVRMIGLLHGVFGTAREVDEQPSIRRPARDRNVLAAEQRTHRPACKVDEFERVDLDRTTEVLADGDQGDSASVRRDRRFFQIDDPRHVGNLQCARRYCGRPYGDRRARQEKSGEKPAHTTSSSNAGQRVLRLRACGAPLRMTRAGQRRTRHADATGRTCDCCICRHLRRARRRPVRHLPFGGRPRPFYADDCQRVSRVQQHRRRYVAFCVSLLADTVRVRAVTLALSLGFGVGRRPSRRDRAGGARAIRDRAQANQRCRRGGLGLRRAPVSAAPGRNVHGFSRNGVSAGNDRVAVVGHRRPAVRNRVGPGRGGVIDQGGPGARDGIFGSGRIHVLCAPARASRDNLRRCRNRCVDRRVLGILRDRTTARRCNATLDSEPFLCVEHLRVAAIVRARRSAAA